MSDNKNNSKNSSLYWWGIVGFIPVLGAIVGLILTLLGIFKYKDRNLILIGIGCIAFTVILNSIVYFKLVNDPDFFLESTESISQFELNTITKEIEIFKLKKGRYPNSLNELDSSLRIEGNFVALNDPLQFGSQNNKSGYFNYYIIGDKYRLFSSGKDKTENTADDIYPNLQSEESNSFGYLKKNDK